MAQTIASRAVPPKQSLTPGGHMRTWNARQQQRFLERVRDDRYHAAWLLLITTGMRRDEILGLRWVDVDLDQRTVQAVRDWRKAQHA